MRTFLRAVLWWSTVTLGVPLLASAQIQVAPDNATHLDKKIRLVNSTGNQVNFTITNLGADASFVRTCTSTGNVTSVTCSPLGIVAQGTSKVVTATFATTGPGVGTVEISVTLQGQSTVLGLGKWDETIVNPGANVTPDGAAVTKAPNLTGTTQAFTVTNTSRAAGTYAVAFTCPPTGVSGCSLSPTTLVLDSAGVAGASGTATVTYNTLAAGTTGTMTATASYNGAALDQGSATISMPNAAVTPDAGAQTVGPNLTGQTATFTIQNTGPVGATFDLTVGCTAPISNCSLSAPTVNPNPTLSQNVTVTFRSGASGAGVITVTAKYGGATLDNGTITATIQVVAPVVAVTPKGGAPLQVPPNSARSFSFNVAHSGLVPSTYTLAAVCTTPGATGCPASLSPLTFAAAGNQTVPVAFTSGPPNTTGRVKLTAIHSPQTAVKDTGYVDVQVVSALVTPKNAAVMVPANTVGLTYAFQIQNTGLSPTTFPVAVTCTPSVTPCSASVPSVTLAAGALGSVTVTYNSAAAGSTGTITLTASFSGVTVDQGSINVTAQTQSAPTVDVANVNPEGVLERGQCVALALGSAAASECGDLRIVHSLPAVRTLSQWRSPMLTYNSAHATGWVSVGANVGLPAGSAVPVSVTASLTIGGVVRATGSWTGGQWNAGSVRRIAVGFDAATAGLATGSYAYSLSVANNFGAPSPPTTVATGTVLIVNRSASYFGAGWWLSGLEEWNPTTAAWVGGDGSARQYVLRPGSAAPNRVWGAPSVTYPDSVREIAGEFVRQLPDSVWVFFNAQGLHVRTRNRLGHVTQFGYDGSTPKRLLTITVPTWTAPALSYTFNYNTGTGKLATVVAPGATGSRTTTIGINAGRVAQIQDPDSRVVRFDSTSSRITARVDRRGTVTNFQYDGGNRVSRSTILMVAVPNIVRDVTQALSAGFNGTAVDTTAVYTRLNGPRPNVNVTVFYPNRLGAPTRIIDAANQTTTLVRSKPGFLGLVTQLTTVTGQPITATYDARGRLQTTAQPLPVVGLATTTYIWDAKWDMVTKIVNPQGDYTDFGVDPASGNRLWQQDGRGLSSRTSFTYHATQQLATFALPGTIAQTYGYDGLGNLNTFDSALDYFWTWTNDPIGRTTGISSPTGTHVGGSPYQTESIAYSLRNEETQRVTAAGGQTITVSRGLDEEGNLLAVQRTFSPNPQGIGTLTTSWGYDRANRVTTQIEPDGQSETRGLDEAGNVLTLVPRLGGTITMTYDGLNRMGSRSVPGGYPNAHPASFILPATAVNILPYAFTVPADGQAFTYYPDGQVATATNVDASVGRSYHPSGLLTSETLQIRTADRSGFGTHSYTTSYQYDLDGRRTGLTAPSQFPGNTMTFGYHPQWGALTSALDIQGNAFGFSYSDRGDLTGRSYPGSVGQTLGYDADGRLSSDNISGATQGFPYPPFTVFRALGIGARDAATKIRTSTDGALWFDQARAGYSGLGYLQTPFLQQKGLDGSGQLVTYSSGDTLSYDGIGNLVATVHFDTLGPNASRVASTRAFAGNGRLSGLASAGSTTTYTYDTQGNTYFEAQTGLPTGGNGRERAAWYGRDGRLRATDSRTSGRRIFEEYRYDALGRRVWVRQRTQCEPINDVTCAYPFARRTIWDGTQELAEIQAPYDPAVPSLEELDSGWPLQPFNVLAGTDPNPFYGRVVYSPGLVTDQPLSVTRYDYRDYPNGANTLTWPTFTLVPYWNYQGVASFGTFSDGKSYRPSGPGLTTSCPILGNPTTPRCVIVQWQFGHSAYDQNRGNVKWRSWQGSLLEGKRDRSGLDYRRARVYDPTTGRFTQEDPIGLAGGLNLYGFAGGDPVNFGDPLGLKVRREGGAAFNRTVDWLYENDSDFRMMYDLLDAADEEYLLIEARPFEGALTGFSTQNTEQELAAFHPTFLTGQRFVYKQYWDPDRTRAAAVIGPSAFCNSLAHEVVHLTGALLPSGKIYQHGDEKWSKEAAAGWALYPAKGPRPGSLKCPQ